MADSSTGAGNIHDKNMTKLEHLVIPESKEVYLMGKKVSMGACERDRDTGAYWESSQWPKPKQFEQKINKVILDHRFLLI